MKKTDSLQRRIALAFLKLAVGGCLFFGVLAIIAVEGIEDYLVDDRLENVASWAIPRHAAGIPVDMPAGLSFYRGDAIPSELRHLPQGVHEVFLNGNELHVLTGKDATGIYVVVDHDSEYDKIEWVVYSTIGLGLLGFLGLSLMLGQYVARQVVTPITTLAHAVKEQGGQMPLPCIESEDEVGDLARAFAVRTDELNHFLQRERFFTGDVSHELRTPLTVIIGAAEIIHAEASNQPTLAAASERILRAAGEAAECINVLLLLARSPERIDAPQTLLSAVAQEEVTHSLPLLGGKTVTLECLIEEDFSFGARPELLAMAIGNLIRNACQYTDTGSITVRVKRPFVVVEDTGPGIPDWVRAKMLHQAHAVYQADTKGSAGSGLGLALAARICEHLNVHLDVARREQGGTAFTFNFSGDLTQS